MMDASLPADQSGLSDLSAASIASVAPYLGHTSPAPELDEITSKTEPPVSATASGSACASAATPVLSSSPGPSRFGAEHMDRPGAAWTPSPDASTSRSSANRRSMRRPSPINKNANESASSSLGMFDFSNASFSESFLRQAGAHMLAGLDEAALPPATLSSSSPSYRTSSSPTVTVKPVREHPRTPFTGKSLRTRMAEAGMLDSPASSDGSSPSPSPNTRMVSGSSTSPSQAVTYRETRQGQNVQSLSDSPHTEHSTSNVWLPHKEEELGAEAPLHSESPRNSDIVGGEQTTNQEGEWEEGLSVVPEESYVEESYRLAPPSAALADVVSSTPSASSPLDVDRRSLPSHTPAPSSARAQVDSPAPRPIAPVDAQLRPSSPELKLEHMSPPASPPHSPQLPLTDPPTPQSAPRSANTPRSFARLRMVTPARSSPLSHVVNFSPSSNGSESRWQSPASQCNATESEGDSATQKAEQAHESRSSAIAALPQSSQAVEQSCSSQQLAVATKVIEGQQTPKGTPLAERTNATPSHFWSPANSNSFATPASQRASAPCTPSPATKDTIASPAADFGTPQWSPDPAPDAVVIEDDEDVKPQQDAAPELNSPSLSSTSSSASEKKQCGDTSNATVQSQLHSNAEDKKFSLSFSFPAEHLDSPSAARCSRMQLSRLMPKLDPSLGSALSLTSSVPELALVASAFDSLTHLTDDRVARLLSQLSASTARVEELEAALEARDHEREEHESLRYTLSQLSSQYQELLYDADKKELEILELAKKLQAQLVSGSAEAKAQELQRELEKERRLREVQRRDYEVRIQALLNPSTTTCAAMPSLQPETTAELLPPDDQVPRAAVETAKEQLRLSLEKDFQVRRSIEQRELQTRIEQLELQLASASSNRSASALPAAELSPTMDKQERSEVQRRLDELTVELDRRFEELADVREQLDAVTSSKERAEDRIGALEAELAAIHQDATIRSEANEKVDELERELETLGAALADKESEIERLNETLALTSSRLGAVTTEHGAMQERIGLLESHIDTLQTQLHTGTGTGTPSPEANRTVQLERQLAHLNLQLVKLQKAHDALAADNVHFSIALSAKQLELGMVKRNARFALKSRPVLAIGLPESQKSAKTPEEGEGEGGVQFPKVPTGGLATQSQPMNSARAHARQMLAQRRAVNPETVAGGGADGGEKQRRMALAA